MPTYSYVCPDCGDKEDVFHEMTANVRIVCDSCLIEKVRKPQFGGAIFKGGGWAHKE